MPARPLRILLDFLTYDGIPPTNNPVDETRSLRRVEESTVSDAVRYQTQIAAPTTAQVVPLAGAACEYLAIYCDQPVSINLNGDSTAIALTPQTAGCMCPVFYLRGNITSLTITNSGSLAANVDIRSVQV
jgi:hypothetical protein